MFWLELWVLICGPLAEFWVSFWRSCETKSHLLVTWHKFAVQAPVCVIFWEIIKCRKLDGVGKQWDVERGSQDAQGGVCWSRGRRRSRSAVLGLRSGCVLADLSSMFAHTNKNCDSNWPGLAWPGLGFVIQWLERLWNIHMMNIQWEMWETVQEIQCAELLEEWRFTKSSDPRWALNRGTRGKNKNLPLRSLLSRYDLSSLFTE